MTNLQPIVDALSEVAKARRRFKPGDRVTHANGWHGVVTGEPCDSNVCMCRFDDVGQFGADPRKLRHAHPTKDRG